MERNRKQKLLMIIALVFGIVSLSVGFAAFSATLNISSSASVTPDGSAFSVVFSGSDTDLNDDSIEPIVTGSVTATDATVVGKSLSGIDIEFTDTSGRVAYEFYVYNNGAYPIYLRSIDFGSSKSCQAIDNVNIDLLEEACNKMSIEFWNYDGSIVFHNGSGKYDFGGHKMEPGSVEQFTLIFNAPRILVDGKYKISFDDIMFEYSTADAEEINFTVLGKTYTAKNNMTWYDFINSEYNVDDFSLSPHDHIVVDDVCLDESLYDIIEANTNYEIAEDQTWC